VIQYLKQNDLSFEIVKYLDQSFDKNTLSDVLKKIDRKPSEILRKNEVPLEKRIRFQEPQ
jgi:arsenate reductase-like glutaredoxin family protein